MKRVALLGALLGLALAVGWGASTLRSQEGPNGAKAADQKQGAGADRVPPGIKKGVRVSVHYSGRDDETWLVREVRGNWVRITFQDADYWANFDNVIYYSFKN
jgi:hypothetical protein